MLSGPLRHVKVSVASLSSLAAACHVQHGLLVIHNTTATLPLGVAHNDVLVAAGGIDALGNAARALKLLPTLTNDEDSDEDGSAPPASESIDVWVMRPDDGAHGLVASTLSQNSVAGVHGTHVVTAKGDATHTGVISPAAQEPTSTPATRVVTLQRVNGRFGVSIVNHAQTAPFYVSSTLSPAVMAAGLKPFDRILQFNGLDVAPLQSDVLVRMMVNAGETLTLMVVNDEPGFVAMARKAEIGALIQQPASKATSSPMANQRVVPALTSPPPSTSSHRKTLFSRLRQSFTSLGSSSSHRTPLHPKADEPGQKTAPGVMNSTPLRA